MTYKCKTAPLYYNIRTWVYPQITTNSLRVYSNMKIKTHLNSESSRIGGWLSDLQRVQWYWMDYSITSSFL